MCIYTLMAVSTINYNKLSSTVAYCWAYLYLEWFAIVVITPQLVDKWGRDGLPHLTWFWEEPVEIEMEIVLHMFMHGFMVMWMVCHWLMLSIFPASQPIQSCGATASIESKPVRLPMDWREGTGWVGTCWSSPISSFWCWNLQFWLSFSWRNTSWEESQGASACFYAVPSLLSESMAISRKACVFICKYTNLHIHPQTLHNPTYLY